MNNLIHVT